MTDVWRVERPAKDADSQSLLRYDRGGRRTTELSDLAIRRVVLASGFARVARVVLVIDRRVGLVQPQVRFTCLRCSRMEPNHVLEVDDRRVVRFTLEVVLAGLVVLGGEPLVEQRE